MEGLSIRAFISMVREFFLVADNGMLMGCKVRKGTIKAENWNVLTPHRGRAILSPIPKIWIARY